MPECPRLQDEKGTEFQFNASLITECYTERRQHAPFDSSNLRFFDVHFDIIDEHWSSFARYTKLALKRQFLLCSISKREEEV